MVLRILNDPFSIMLAQSRYGAHVAIGGAHVANNK